MPDSKKPMAIKVATRPQDWIPATRVYLFGWNALSPQEEAEERTRMSHGRLAYGPMRERG